MGGMEVGDWITLAAVIVALGLGLSSLIQTHMLQKRERKERLLNEIIEWASNITKVEWYKDYPSMFNIQDKEKLKAFMGFHLGELHSNLTSMRAQNHYISGIAWILDKDLYKSIMELILCFEAHIIFIKKWIDALAIEEEEEKKVIEKLNQNELKLDELSKKVIEEVIEIKARDIGKGGDE